jgi:hypothetical protein
MTKEKPKWMINQEGDGDKPICPFCNKDYGDGAIFNVKNYPADGGAILFLECESCNKEAKIHFDWTQLQKKGEDLVYIKS